MIFAKRASLSYLAGLCRRLAIELSSGIDVRKTWAREVDRAPPGARDVVDQVRLGISRGDSLSDALERTGSYFPPIFRRLVDVGESTGNLAETFRRLAEDYEHQITLRRTFRNAIAWPVIQLVLAIAVIGILILVMGFIQQTTGNRVDILGWGLAGWSGLAIYLGVLSVVFFGLALAIRAVLRGALWIQPVQMLAMRLPGIGPLVQTLALARFAWTFQLTLDSGMEIRRALDLSLATTRNAYYTAHTDQILRWVSSGGEVHEALAETGAFPPAMVDAVEVGERSGRLTETLAVLATQYREQAIAALSIFNRLAGMAVWGVVALLIIMMIFRIFSFYMNALQGAMP